ncbi:MAG: outer membrane lipoprotein-sorting protein [Marinilabiliales bacterium]|nr:MAG: outer membrane lipoprotein-sorting protein [Marinilabiliales bacterium]
MTEQTRYQIINKHQKSNIMKTTLIITIMLASAFIRLNGQDAGEISQRAADIIDIEAMEMAATLNIHDHRGNVRTRQVAIATRTFNGTAKTLIRFLSPADVRGTSMLVHDHENGADDMWIYMPALRRTRRIVSSERSASFMGSEFTNADMGSRNPREFEHKMLGSETVEGRESWVIESVPLTEQMAEENGYSRMVARVDKENYHTYKVEYYDLDGELHRVMEIGDYRRQSADRYWAFSMEVRNVQNNRRSVLAVDRFQDGSELSENQFEVSALEDF